ncbi:MAG: HAMP domain-containing protein [Alphaproteobacteria bacterium]|nr:HAMP domain-containing protein [Alphaproteobacteria bacterium]
MAQSTPTSESPRPVRRRRFSPLTRRILFLNMAPPVILVAGLLYLDDYRNTLIDNEFASLVTQGRIFAAALGTAATVVQQPGSVSDGAADDEERLSREIAPTILRRLVEPTRVRARLYSGDGELIADSRVLGAAGVAVEIAPLPPPRPPSDPLLAAFNAAYDFILNWLPSGADLPPDREQPNALLHELHEAEAASRGEIGTALRARATSGRPQEAKMTLYAAVPVQRFKQVLGVLLMTTDSREIENSLRAVRLDILQVFAAALAVTVLISFYLARTIARPVRRLALAAERVRRGGQVVAAGIRASGPLTGRAAIPDMSARGDEIGDLSLALGDMTEALWRRLDAIERFAADVAHEIKNPLTSLKSAVETAARVQDPARQRKLMQVILDDVSRLDRLIADISDASRIDAELSREETHPTDIGRLLATLVDIHGADDDPGAPRLSLELAAPEELIVPALEDRLGQVFRNLIANAISFSPPRGTIRILAVRREAVVEVCIEDEGPGIPEDKLEKIFERFYSERPSGEKFGTHSGLGLSISRQIVTAHGGSIRAENRRDAGGRVVGARFLVRLPVS